VWTALKYCAVVGLDNARNGQEDGWMVLEAWQEALEQNVLQTRFVIKCRMSYECWWPA
jgi:hypothetical protein